MDQHPAVAAILAIFPGATITSVTYPPATEPHETAAWCPCHGGNLDARCSLRGDLAMIVRETCDCQMDRRATGWSPMLAHRRSCVLYGQRQTIRPAAAPATASPKALRAQQKQLRDDKRAANLAKQTRLL